MRISHIAALIIAMLVSASGVWAKSWRNINPIHSTRANVRRLLGVPTKSADYADYYELSNEIALVWYEVDSCDSHLGKMGFNWNVPRGTVTAIGVIPKQDYRKEKLQTKHSWKVDDYEAGFVYYTDETEGISVETFHGRVTAISYLPAEKESSLRCPQIIKCCVDPFHRFDEYQNLSWKDEKARLDNYAIAMKERLDRGVIVVYGPNQGERAKLMKRALRAQKYLYQKRLSEPNRILVADGGHRDVPIFALQLYTIGNGPWRISLFPSRDPK